MKKLTMLLLMIMFLSACSSARPVIRMEEPGGGKAMAETSAAPTEEGDPYGKALPDETVREALTMAAKEKHTVPEKTKPEQLISASDKNVAVNSLSDGTTQSSQPQPTATTPVQTQPANVPGMSTQPPASLTSTIPAQDGVTGETPDGGGVDSARETMSAYNLFDYYPLVPNREVHFSSESAGPSVRILQYLYEERGKATAQIKQIGQDGEHLNVIRIDKGLVNDLYYSVESPYRSNIIGWTGYEERTILKEPLEVGNQWESTGLEFEITAVDEQRMIADQEMTVLDVMVTGGDETLLFTYALGLGLVSNDIVNPDGTLTNLLHFQGLNEEAFDIYDIALFFPTDDGNYTAVTVAAPFQTNDAPKDIITQIYKEVASSKGYTPVFGESALIQYIFLEERIARVDLNEGFIKFMNEAPELESPRIQSLVNTISKYYEAEGVILTVNDQRYESAQLMFELTEVLSPDYRYIINPSE